MFLLKESIKYITVFSFKLFYFLKRLLYYFKNPKQHTFIKKKLNNTTQFLFKKVIFNFSY